MNRRLAFTLIELLVVVAIISLLMAILLPSLSNARKQAQRIVCASNLRQLGVGVMMYASDASGKLPPWGYPRNVPSPMPSGNTAWNYVAQINGNYVIYKADSSYKTPSGENDYWIGLGRLWVNKYVKEAKVYFCPTSGYKIANQWTNAGRMNPDDPTNPAPASSPIRSSYHYRSGTNTQWEFPQIGNQLVAASKFIASDIFSGSGTDWSSPLNHGYDGFNVLGAQGNVAWYQGMPDNGVWRYMDNIYRKFDRVAGDTDSNTIQREWAYP